MQACQPCRFLILAALALVTLLPLAARAQDADLLDTRLDFARFLMADRDYFRAISVYKEVLFVSDSPAVQHLCMEQIARAYEKSHRYRASIKYLSRLFNEPGVDPAVMTRGRIRLGLDYYGMRVFFQARSALEKARPDDPSGFALTYLGLIEAERGHWTEAGELFGEAADLAPSPALQAVTRELQTEVLQGAHLPRRSPTLAALMSAIIPGSGQFYCGHTYDGLQAFLYVGAFSLATYAAYRYDHDVNDNYVSTYAVGTVTAMFHAANVIGAYKVAGFHNLRQQEIFLDGVRVKVFEVDF